MVVHHSLLLTSPTPTHSPFVTPQHRGPNFHQHSPNHGTTITTPCKISPLASCDSSPQHSNSSQTSLTNTSRHQSAHFVHLITLRKITHPKPTNFVLAPTATTAPSPSCGPKTIPAVSKFNAPTTPGKKSLPSPVPSSSTSVISWPVGQTTVGAPLSIALPTPLNTTQRPADNPSPSSTNPIGMLSSLASPTLRRSTHP